LFLFFQFNSYNWQLICVVVLVAAASAAPQYPILSPIGFPFLPVQPGSQDLFGRLIPGGFLYPGQGNMPIGSWPWGLMNPMPSYPTNPRFIVHPGTGFPVSNDDSKLVSIKEIKPITPIVPPAKVEDTPVESKLTELLSPTPTVAIPRCNKDNRKRRSTPEDPPPDVFFMVGSDHAYPNQYPFMVSSIFQTMDF
jgi:hypothetical protein